MTVVFKNVAKIRVRRIPPSDRAQSRAIKGVARQLTAGGTGTTSSGSFAFPRSVTHHGEEVKSGLWQSGGTNGPGSDSQPTLQLGARSTLRVN